MNPVEPLPHRPGVPRGAVSPPIEAGAAVRGVGPLKDKPAELCATLKAGPLNIEVGIVRMGRHPRVARLSLALPSSHRPFVLHLYSAELESLIAALQTVRARLVTEADHQAAGVERPLPPPTDVPIEPQGAG